jgi:hypothetical protein
MNTSTPPEAIVRPVDPAYSAPVESKGWLLPAIGAVILVVLWTAFIIPDAIGILSTPAP